ncbi:transcription antitermination protein NusB [Acholeplasma oculi]|nr:transcription antitermination protein NusB [Acholeplasma oculi]
MDKFKENYKKYMKLLYQNLFYNHLAFKDFDALDSEDRAYIESLLERIEQIDAIIVNHLSNYTIDRLNLVDLSIIRIAVYELLKKEIQPEIIINEAIELTKEFSDLDDEKQHKFTNKLIDNIYKSMK